MHSVQDGKPNHHLSPPTPGDNLATLDDEVHTPSDDNRQQRGHRFVINPNLLLQYISDIWSAMGIYKNGPKIRIRPYIR